MKRLVIAATLLATTITTAQAQMPQFNTPNHRLVDDIVKAENAKRAEREKQRAEAVERERQAREKERAEAAERDRQAREKQQAEAVERERQKREKEQAEAVERDRQAREFEAQRSAREAAERQATIEAARQDALRKEAAQKAMDEKAERARKDAEARVALCYGAVPIDKAQELANVAIKDVRATMDLKSPPVDQLVTDRLRFQMSQHLNAESDDTRMPGFTKLTVTKEAAAVVVACYDGVQQLMKEQMRAIEQAKRTEPAATAPPAPPVKPPAATAARADDVGIAKGMMVASLYDRDCEKLPGVEAMIRKLLAEIPASSMRIGMAQARELHQSMATTKFCEMMKPVVADALRAMR